MIWFFDREGERVRYEIRRAADEGYELEVTYPDGRTEVEQMVEPSDLLRRCTELAKALEEDGWKAG